MVLSTAVHKVKLSDEHLTVYMPLKDGRLLQHDWLTNHHCNADYELHIILKGACDVEVEGEQYSLKGSSALLIAPGKYNEPHMVTGEALRVSMSFTPSEGVIEQALCDAVGTAVCFSPSEDLIRYTELLINESLREPPFRASAF